ncbi:MAG: manganese catalase family protein [Oscillospiraceae bacterium]
MTSTGIFREKSCVCKAAAEQKARATYDNILRLSDDPDVNEVIKFLREREVVHFQRFGELLNHYQEQISDCGNKN